MVNITKDDRVKKFSEEDNYEDEEVEDDYVPSEDTIRVRRKSEEPKQREEEVRRASQRYEEPTRREPVKEVTGDKFEAFHQPEVVGIRDKDTDEVIILYQAQTLVDKVGDAIFKAKELSHLDAIRKSV